MLWWHFDKIILNNSSIIKAFEAEIWLMDVESKTELDKHFGCLGKAVTLVTNTKLLNSIN